MQTRLTSDQEQDVACQNMATPQACPEHRPTIDQPSKRLSPDTRQELLAVTGRIREAPIA